MAVAMLDSPTSPTHFDAESEYQTVSDKVEPRRRLKDVLSVRKWLKSEEQPSCPDLQQETQPQTPVRPGVGQRFSRKGLVGLPRSAIFKRQEEEQRKNLMPVQPTIKERRDVSKVRQRALSAAPDPPRQARRGGSVTPDLRHAFPFIDERIVPVTFTQVQQESQEQVPPSPPTPPPQPPLNIQEDEVSISNAASCDDAVRRERIEQLMEMLKPLDFGPLSREQSKEKGFLRDLNLFIDLKGSWLSQKALDAQLKYRDAFLVLQHLSVRSSSRHLIRDAKIKRGLPGFVNGSRTSALADTGASQNIVSAAFVQEKGLSIKENRGSFKLGNSKIAQSIGTVSLSWAFSEKPKETIDIICHVLPQCAYDLILGSKFLTATETFSKHRRRLVDCVFSMFNVFHLNFLDGGRQTLDGKVGAYQVSALPDTGAERNVMNLDYAETRGFKINARPDLRGFLQFADGTFQETVGQVNTTWTFASGLKIPVTFEVLENCSTDVIIGEEVLWEHDVFRSHATSIYEMPYENEEDELLDLTPFSYMKEWQQKTSDFKHTILSKFNKRTHGEETLEDETLEQCEGEERDRRDQWHHQYGFEGENASPAEKEAEARRKRRYDARIEAFRRRPPCPGTTALLISSIPTAPNDASANPIATGTGPRRAPPVTFSALAAPGSTPVHPTATGTGPRRAPPLIPSIPTAPNDAPVHLATTNAKRAARVIRSSTAVVSSDDAPSDPATIDQIRRGLRF